MKSKLLFLILFLLPGFLFANDPIKDLIEQAGDAEKYPNTNVLTVFDSTVVDVQESGLSFVNTHQLFKILTKKGALDLRIVTYGYDPLSAYVEIRKVVIHRANGETQVLDTADVMDYTTPARMIYWGASEKMIEVGRLEPGDALEVFLFKKGYTYALLYDDGGDEKYIPPMRGHYYDIVPFWSNEPVLEKVYQTSVPEDKIIQYEFYNGEVSSSAVLRDEKMIYTFAKTNIMPLKREPNMVAPSDVAPKLLISTSPDWYAKSLWFFGVNEDYGSFESTAEIDAKVDEILQNAQSFDDTVSLLTHWVADEIRYSGISMGEGEGYTLHTGEMNFRDRCGVCKDKAGMLITMLRAAGLESYPAMTMAGSRIDYIPADQFNHCVTVVKTPDDNYQLLDPTWVPFLRELWSSAEQQQNYLMGIPGGADLKITPVSDPENHYFKMINKAEVNKEGDLEGKLTITAEGQSDAAIRRMFTSNYKTEWNDWLMNEMRKVSPEIKIKNIKFHDPYDYMSGPIEIKIEYDIAEYAVATDQEIIFNPVVFSGIFKRAMSHLYINTSLEEREYAFRDRCSRMVVLDEEIKIPEGFKPMTGDFDLEYDEEIATYDGSIDFENNTLKLQEKVSLGKRIYEPDDWPGFRKVVNAQKQFPGKQIILTNKN